MEIDYDNAMTSRKELFVTTKLKHHEPGCKPSNAWDYRLLYTSNMYK